jgi:endoglucanase
MSPKIDRRDFIKGVSAAAALGIAGRGLGANIATALAMPEPTPAKLPRWRGFNLLEKFIASEENAPFREEDFAWIAGWGFNFVRLPMSYRCWSSPGNWREIREPVLKEIDDGVELGRSYGVHVCLNFHRAPGYSVDRSLKEPFNLWTDLEALEACTHHWRHFAARYRNVPNAFLSFDLLNEPGEKNSETGELLDDATYAHVVRTLVEGIRTESPNRLIIADGLMWGNVPVPALAGLGIAQSGRGYSPMEVTHWKAEWVRGSDAWPRPEWPLVITPQSVEAGKRRLAGLRQVFKDNPIFMGYARDEDLTMPWGRERFRHQLVAPWKELERMGIGVHIGEFGAHNRTPHDVVLGWMGDFLPSLAEAGWGWALWNLRGSFGILDSKRTDVAYEDFHGHKLDHRMLELLRAS